MIWRKHRVRSRSDPATVVGVDACPAGWIGVVLHEGTFTQAAVAAGLRELVAALPSASIIAVDIPIGLPANGWRRADIEARRFLGGRSSSVFATPPRAAVEASTYEEANRICRALTGQGLSRQAWALTPKILDVDRCRAELGRRWLRSTPRCHFGRWLAGR